MEFLSSKVRKDVIKGLKSRTIVVVLPDFEKLPNGKWEQKGNVEIKTYGEYIKYARKHKEIMPEIKRNFPSAVSIIWRNAFTELAGPAGATIAGSFADDKNKTAQKVYGMGTRSDAENSVYGILNTLNAKKDGMKGVYIDLPFIRTKEEVYETFKQGKNGYFVPQITENGLVVTPAKGQTHFNINFMAFDASEVTEEEVFAYFIAPFVNSKEPINVNFDWLMGLSKETFRLIGDNKMNDFARAISDFCLKYYPLDLTALEDTKKQIKIEPIPEPVPDPVPEPIPDPHPVPVPVPPKPVPIPDPHPVPVPVPPKPVPVPHPIPVPKKPDPEDEFITIEDPETGIVFKLKKGEGEDNYSSFDVGEFEKE